MTSNDHPTLDELAELAEGLLAPERELAVRAHLDTCADCRRSVERLAATSTALRSLGPVTMPADVVAEIDQALSAAGSTEPAAADPAVDTRADVIPNLAEVRARRRLPTAPTSAAAVLVVLAVVAIVIGFQHKPNNPREAALPANAENTLPPLVGTQSLPSAGSANSAASFSVQTTDRLYTAATLDSLVPKLIHGNATGEAFGADQPGVVPSPTSIVSGTTPDNEAGTGSTGGVNGSGSDAAGPKQVGTPPSTSSKHHPASHSATTAIGGAKAASTTVAALPASLQPYQDDRQKVLGCAAFMTTTSGAIPLAVDLGRWSDPTAGEKNVPAIVMLFSVPGDSTKDLVVVAKPPCGDGDLLKYESVDRPG